MSKEWKGIVLAGGLGTRLLPVTKAVSKHLIPVYDKPMIYYSLSVLMLSSIRDIVIISDTENLKLYQKLFGNGKELGLRLTYLAQDKPNGIGESFIIAENFIKKDNVALILGDNIFHGAALREKLLLAKKSKKEATIFSYQVRDPERFGVVQLDKSNNPISLIEKPSKPKTNLAVTGLYFFKNSVINIAKKIKPSKRKQYEITDINKIYLRRKKLNVIKLGRGNAWLDMGTHDSLLDASNFIRTIEKRQGTKIACIEEYAFMNKWISKKNLLDLAKKKLDDDLSRYLLSVSREKNFWK